MQILNTQPFKIGIQETKKEKEVYIILLQNVVYVQEIIPKFLGHKLKLVQILHGNTRVAY